ncbi:MAG TPA: hypothetical protein VFJ62_21745 [Usitatibacter sp.]|nr:hypothetical protein [Usitatibacter sp.]
MTTLTALVFALITGRLACTLYNSRMQAAAATKATESGPPTAFPAPRKRQGGHASSMHEI